MIESAVSSNRIEGVVVDQTRVRSIVLGRSRLRDCDEQEVRGYRNALKLVHERGSELPVSQDTIRRLHRLARYDVGDAGEYKRKDVDIIERYPNGRARVRFRTVAAAKVEPAVQELVDLWDRALVERRIHPRRALREPRAVRGGTQGALLRAACQEFESRMGVTVAPRGAKTELVASAVERAEGPFRVADLQRACPGVSLDLIRTLLKKWRAAGLVECLGRGQHARWQRTNRWN